MATASKIIEFADELLEVDSFTDYGPNGLQVPGAEGVERVVSCVSAHRAAIEHAADVGADLLIAHHGLFWDFHPRALTEQMAARLRIALGAELGIAGYHLPLDAHPEIGNNVLLARELGFEPSERFAEAKGRPIGWIATRADGLAAEALFGAIEQSLGREPLVLGSGPAKVERIGVITGAGASFVAEAIELGLDALITGEPAEHATADATEGGIHFIAAGHYATETSGVRALGDRIATEFDVEHQFADFPNPV